MVFLAVFLVARGLALRLLVFVFVCVFVFVFVFVGSEAAAMSCCRGLLRMRA